MEWILVGFEMFQPQLVGQSLNQDFWYLLKTYSLTVTNRSKKCILSLDRIKCKSKRIFQPFDSESLMGNQKNKVRKIIRSFDFKWFTLEWIVLSFYYSHYANPICVDCYECRQIQCWHAELLGLFCFFLSTILTFLYFLSLLQSISNVFPWIRCFWN